MPVTDTEALGALPPDGWMRHYIHHAVKQTTAPLIYHFGVGLATLAVTCPPDYGMNYAGKLRPNLYALLVGRSGEDNKSTALNIGGDLLREVEPRLIGNNPGSPEGMVESLTEREMEVLTAVAEGWSNKEVSEALHISPHTVQVHLSNIFGKLGVKTRTEAVLYAIRQGWVEV